MITYKSPFSSHIYTFPFPNHKASHICRPYSLPLKLITTFYFLLWLSQKHKHTLTHKQSHTLLFFVNFHNGSLRPISQLTCPWIPVLIKNTLPFEYFFNQQQSWVATIHHLLQYCIIIITVTITTYDPFTK